MTVFNDPYIRDEIRIGPNVQTYYNSCAGDGPAVLLARKITFKPPDGVWTGELRVNRIPLIIVTDEYDGTGGWINASGSGPGANGTHGANGASPWPQYDHNEIPVGPGGHGSSGTDGGAGGHASSVTIWCRTSRNAIVHALAFDAGAGGNGGHGGWGVNGYHRPAQTIRHDLTPDDPNDDQWWEEIIEAATIDGTPGGDGGWGGSGGAGGNGATITFTSVMDETVPDLRVRDGIGGAPGNAGAAGGDGSLSPTAAVPGTPGAWGANGTPAHIARTNVTEVAYIAGLRSVLDFEEVSYANYWAPFRIWVGDYFYHRYNPLVPDRDGDALLAATEFARALELQHDNVEAARLQAQLVGVETQTIHGETIWMGGGSNALGLPADLDLQPSFDRYIDAYLAVGSFMLSFLEMGMSELLASDILAKLKDAAEDRLRWAEQARAHLTLDLDLAATEKSLSTDESDRAQALLDKTTVEIYAALEEMKAAELEIDSIGFVGTLAQVAVAVVGVASAVGTGGASLVALVPAMVSISDSLIDSADPVAALFSSKNGDEELKKEVEKVGKKIDSVVKAGKSIVNLVEVVNKLASAKTSPDNAKHLALVRRGADLAHQVLLARNKVIVVDQRHQSVQVKLKLAETIEAKARAVAEAESITEPEAALSSIAVVQSKAESLLNMAFMAQRSLEIYTLEPLGQHVLLDAGLVHPDIIRGYEAREIGLPGLFGALKKSWQQLLAPTEIKTRWERFAKDLDVLRLSFTAADPQFASLVSDGRFDFRVEANEIDAGQHDAKAVGVRLAFFGATHPNLQVSCDVRHGATYEQRRESGTVHQQRLKSLVSNRVAGMGHLGTGPQFSGDPAPPDAGSLAFWGRGIGGDWEITVTSADHADLVLSDLVEIQVWIDYRFHR